MNNKECIYQDGRSQKILIINPFGIGDVLFTTPLIASLKSFNPAASISYLCNSRSHAVLKNNPALNKIFIYDRDEYVDLFAKSKMQFFKKSKQFFNDIKVEKFDTLLDLSLGGQYSFWAKLAGIKNRIGLSFKGRNRFLTEKIDIKGYENKHVIEHYFDLLDLMHVPIAQKNMEVSLEESDLKWAEELTKKEGLSACDGFIGIAPGGGASWGQDARYKQWSAANYLKLADKLIAKTRCGIILMGDKSDSSLCREIERKFPRRAFNLAGTTTIGQFTALAKQCRFVVLNDGGLLHICVAAGVKTVSIFGPVDPVVYGPYPSEGHVVITNESLACRPCYHRFRRAECSHISCLNDIKMNQVFERIESLI